MKRLDLVLARAFGEKISAQLAHHAFPKTRLALHNLQKSSAQLGLLYDLKNNLPWKTKKELISNIFANL